MGCHPGHCKGDEWDGKTSGTMDGGMKGMGFNQDNSRFNEWDWKTRGR